MPRGYMEGPAADEAERRLDELGELGQQLRSALLQRALSQLIAR